MRAVPRLFHRSHVPNNLIDPSIREKQKQVAKGNEIVARTATTGDMWRRVWGTGTHGRHLLGVKRLADHRTLATRTHREHRTCFRRAH